MIDDLFLGKLSLKSKYSIKQNIDKLGKIYYKDSFINLSILIFILIWLVIPLFSASKFDFDDYIPHMVSGTIFLWITVQLIDRMLKKRESIYFARREYINEIKEYLKIVYTSLHDIHENQYSYLKFEVETIIKKWNDDNRLFSNSFTNKEIEIISRIHLLMTQINEEYLKLVLLDNNNPSDQESKVQYLNVMLNSLKHLQEHLLLLVEWMFISNKESRLEEV